MSQWEEMARIMSLTGKYGIVVATVNILAIIHLLPLPVAASFYLSISTYPA